MFVLKTYVVPDFPNGPAHHNQAKKIELSLPGSVF
jgi:hypothetical protein